jgi:hypothetical protein
MRLERLPLLAPAAIALVTALWGGLARLGWALPATHPGAAMLHGPLMISGFLGTLITLERATALGLVWPYAAPLATGLGALAMASGLGLTVGPWATLAGSMAGLVLFARLLGRSPALFLATMTLGLGAWAIGNALWLAGWPIPRVVPWWAAFVILVIAGERLELTRIFPPPPGARALFVGALAVLGAGVVATVVAPGAGMRVAGAGMIALAAWLARHDVARRTIREEGLTRYMAACLLSGYAWLAASGLLALREGLVGAGPQYDAVLHALFLGFVMAMIFGHAPVILPGVLGLPLAWRPAFYGPLVALHATLLLRIVADLALLPTLRQWAGLLNAVVVLAFLAGTALTAVRAR